MWCLIVQIDLLRRNIKKMERDRNDRVIMHARRVIRESQRSVDAVYQGILQSKMEFIENDQSHLLCGQSRRVLLADYDSHS